MRSQAVFFALFFVLLGPLRAQVGTEPGILRGFVKDATTGETIPYVTLVLQGTVLGTSSTATGYFVIPFVPPGTYILSVSHVGYERLERPVTVTEATTLDVPVELTSTVLQSEGATVYRHQEIRPHEADLGLERLSVRDIMIVPAGVEMDIFKVLQFLPGVSTTSDVSSRYYVRGGGSDQNVFWVNHAMVYNPLSARSDTGKAGDRMFPLLRKTQYL